MRLGQTNAFLGMPPAASFLAKRKEQGRWQRKAGSLVAG